MPVYNLSARRRYNKSKDFIDEILNLDSSSLDEALKLEKLLADDVLIKQEPDDDDAPIEDVRDRQKKDNHNMIERRRRFNINDRIKELGTLLPNKNEFLFDIIQDLHVRNPNKGTILKSSVSYIKCLKYEVNRLRRLEQKEKESLGENERLLMRIKDLEVLAKSHGIPIEDYEVVPENTVIEEIEEVEEIATDSAVESMPSTPDITDDKCILNLDDLEDLMDNDKPLNSDPLLSSFPLFCSPPHSSHSSTHSGPSNCSSPSNYSSCGSSVSSYTKNKKSFKHPMPDSEDDDKDHNNKRRKSKKTEQIVEKYTASKDPMLSYSPQYLSSNELSSYVDQMLYSSHYYPPGFAHDSFDISSMLKTENSLDDMIMIV